MAAFRAWQADAMKRTVDFNREGNRRGARHYLSRELRWLERYARDLPGDDPVRMLSTITRVLSGAALLDHLGTWMYDACREMPVGEVGLIR